MITILDQAGHVVTHAMMVWYETKMFIEHASVVNSDGLHVLVGVVAWVLAAMVSRRSLSAPLPWLVVLVLIVLNECVDLWVEQWPDKAMQYGESAKDILLTMTLPTLLMFAVRLRPALFRPGSLRGKRGR